jgi:hypothetical protein
MISFHLICILLFVPRRTCEVWHSNSNNNFKLSPWTFTLSTSLWHFCVHLIIFLFTPCFLLNDVLLQELRWGKNFVYHACSIAYSLSLSHKPLMLCCLSSLMLSPLSPLPKPESSLAFFFYLIPWVSILKLRCEGACRCPGAESKVPYGRQFSRQAKAYTSPGMSFQNNYYTQG